MPEYPNCGKQSHRGGRCCVYSVDGVPQDAGVKLTHTGANVTVELHRLGECPTPVAVAIGGGGRGASGGGGSGYESHTAELPPGAYVKMIAFAGGPGQDSYVRDVDGDSFIVRGERGGDGEGWNGGAGHSGGGGNGCPADGNGGFAGSRGENGSGCKSNGLGGEGSGLDVTAIPLRNFKLSAGARGRGGRGGGGGGGVLVQDTGPRRPKNGIGEGYGGGGGGWNVDGLPGLILFDFVPEE